jgi:hypothetical protein
MVCVARLVNFLCCVFYSIFSCLWSVLLTIVCPFVFSLLFSFVFSLLSLVFWPLHYLFLFDLCGFWLPLWYLQTCLVLAYGVAIVFVFRFIPGLPIPEKAYKTHLWISINYLVGWKTSASKKLLIVYYFFHNVKSQLPCCLNIIHVIVLTNP